MTRKRNGKYVYVENPWDGGQMTLREFFEREEEQQWIDNKLSLADFLPRDKKKIFLNHIRKDSVAYQFLWFDAENGYSSQSLFYRKQRGKNQFKPIAMDVHIPYEYLLVVADAFEKGGLKAAQYMIGV